MFEHKMIELLETTLMILSAEHNRNTRREFNSANYFRFHKSNHKQLNTFIKLVNWFESCCIIASHI